MRETIQEVATRTGKTTRQVLREIQDTYKDPHEAAQNRQRLAVSLWKGGATYDQIGKQLNVSKSAVGKYLSRARKAGQL